MSLNLTPTFHYTHIMNKGEKAVKEGKYLLNQNKLKDRHILNLYYIITFIIFMFVLCILYILLENLKIMYLIIQMLLLSFLFFYYLKLSAYLRI